MSVLHIRRSDPDSGIAVPPEAGAFARQALRGAAPVFIDELGGRRRGSKATELSRAAGVAIRIDGEPVGALTVYRRNGRVFSEEDVSFCQAIANVLASAMQRSKAEADLLENQRRLAIAEAEEALQRAERLAALGTLAAGIAHEINNPLNAIWMTAELAKQNVAAGRDSARVEELLDRIVAECKRTASITHGVLNYARKDGALPATPLDINDTARSLPGLLADKLASGQAMLELDLAETLPAVKTHSIEMERVLANLVQNAVEQGARHIVLQTALGNDGTKIVIRVLDDGPGIPDENLHRIFDPFFSTRRAAGGTGLGLSLVHRFVADLGGAVRATNRPDGGAEFTIELPVSAEAEAAS